MRRKPGNTWKNPGIIHFLLQILKKIWSWKNVTVTSCHKFTQFIYIKKKCRNAKTIFRVVTCRATRFVWSGPHKTHSSHSSFQAFDLICLVHLWLTTPLNWFLRFKILKLSCDQCKPRFVLQFLGDKACPIGIIDQKNYCPGVQWLTWDLGL